MTDSPPAVGVTLADFPQELLVRIARSLTTPELGCLRRSCKHIERQLFDSFAREFFTKRQFMIEHESLEALVGISKHPGLASKLTEVIISTHVFDAGPELNDKRLHSGYVGRRTLLDTGLARDMLVEVFSNLPNLRTIGIRDYDGTGRTRDGETACWRSWGSARVTPVGMHPGGTTTILPLLLLALGRARSRPTNIEVFLRHFPHLTPESFSLNYLGLDSSVYPVLGGLKTLMLAMTANIPNALHLGPGSHSGYREDNIVETPLRQFLHQVPALESLRLNFRSEEYFGYRIIDWLGRSATSTIPKLNNPPVPPVRFAHLKSLDLGMANVPAAALVRTLVKFDLESIGLWKMTLHVAGTNSTSQDCWSQFLLDFSTALSTPSRLRSVMIGYATQCHYPANALHTRAYGTSSPIHVSFVPPVTDPAKKAEAEKKESVIDFKAQFSGKTIHQWLRDMSALTFVPGIHTEPPTSHSDSEAEWISDLE